jgi:hypothetical protein
MAIGLCDGDSNLASENRSQAAYAPSALPMAAHFSSRRAAIHVRPYGSLAVSRSAMEANLIPRGLQRKL